MYSGWPWPSSAVAVFSHSGPLPADICATVIGISSSELAKIGGMTPETFSFSGRCELSPPNIRLPTWRLGYWTRMRRCERSIDRKEHTSELQSLMRISYAVFCLKKKNKHQSHK